jgi:hypothetical protein
VIKTSSEGGGLMLSVSSLNYFLPVRTINSDNEVRWWLNRIDSDDAVYAKSFNYTVIDGDEKATFVFNGSSVKPSPRTLRIYGAERTGSYVSILSRNVKVGLHAWINTVKVE